MATVYSTSRDSRSGFSARSMSDVVRSSKRFFVPGQPCAAGVGAPHTIVAGTPTAAQKLAAQDRTRRTTPEQSTPTSTRGKPLGFESGPVRDDNEGYVGGE